MKRKSAFLNMAFGAARESKETVVKRYIGIAPVYIKGVNPTKVELEAFYGENANIKEEPTYTSVDDKGVRQIRIDFLLQTTEKVLNANGEPLNLKSKISFFVSEKSKVSTNGSVQVINLYGGSSFIPQANIDAGTMPENQSWFETDGLRTAYEGEAVLTDFIKKYLNIPNVSYKDSKTGIVHTLENKSEAACQFEHIEDWFKGDVSEIRDAVNMQPNNRVKVCFGVKTTENGQYQDIYTRMVLKAGMTSYTKLEQDIQSAKANGAYPNTEFEICELKEYIVASTSFAQPSNAKPAANPWDN